MARVELGEITLNVQEDGDPDGAPVVFCNSLGTTLSLWDKLVPLLPEGLRIIRFDNRGHGQSDAPEGPYKMGALVSDAERVIDHCGIKDCLFVGLSIGGMIAQGLAVKRMDQVRAMVLSNTGAKIGTPDLWQTRIDTVKSEGVAALTDAVMERWFSKPFREGPEIGYWREMLEATPDHGYAGCSAAIAGADYYETTATLTLPTLAIAGSEDGATPPDLVRETASLIKGSEFHLIQRAGHLPCVEEPENYAETLTGFLRRIGHI